MIRVRYAVIILLAFIAAVMGYEYFSCPASMLVLQAKTYEKGSRRITIIDNNGGSHELKFEIGNDLGEPSFYPIDLPRVVPREIKIAPLAGRGKFEVDKITLQNGEISYSWNSQNVCSKKSRQDGIIRQEQSCDGKPFLTMAENSEITITGIPPTGYCINMVMGIIAGICGFFAILAAGCWYCRPFKADNTRDKVIVLLSRGCWLLVLSAYLTQFLAIWQYSVDIPFYEEWDFFLPKALQSGLTWDWLFDFSGYHRVVPTRLMAWVNLQLFGMDFRLQKMFNYLIFGGLLVTISRLKNRIIGKDDFVLFPLFMLFLLSPIAFENHSNSYQSQIHLVIILALLALFHIYADNLQTRSLGIFFFCLIAAINTFSAGMTISSVLFPCWALFVLSQIATGRVTRQRGILLLLTGSTVVAITAASWVFSFRQPSGWTWVTPLSGLFWDTFFNLLSFGFGFEIVHPLPGVICLVVVVLPLILLWRDKELRSQTGVWQVTTGVLVFLAILVTISITRGSAVGTSKLSRYAEFGLILIPLTSIAWWLALRRSVKRSVVIALLWGACFVSFIDDWSFSPYRDAGQMGRFVLEALEDYFVGHVDVVFPWTHPDPLTPFFEGARKLNVRFTRQFRELAEKNRKLPVIP
jgi:hypothetical protein